MFAWKRQSCFVALLLAAGANADAEIEPDSAGSSPGGDAPARSASRAEERRATAPCGCAIEYAAAGGAVVPASDTDPTHGAGQDAGSVPVDSSTAPLEKPGLLESRLEPKGRFMLGVESADSDEYDRRYGVRQARLGLAFREGPIRAEVEADLADNQVLNEAWLEYRAGEWGRGRVGRFKAPFSSFLLLSSWERPVLRREGLQRAVRELGFGGRDIGAKLTYEAKELARLRVDLGLFEGAALGASAASEDGYLRVEAAPWKPFRVGASLGRRAFFEGRGAGDAIGLDARLRLGGVTARVEALQAENAVTGATASGMIGHVAYRFPVGGRSWLEPAVEAELASHDDRDARSSWAATIGTGWDDRFLVRGGVEHGADGPLEAESTAILLQAGVQL